MNVKNTKSAGGVVINKNGDILIVNQHGDSWSLPKGHVEKGEEILEAAEREIYEESGIKHLSLLKELGHYQRYRIGLDGPDDQSEQKDIYLFLFKTDDMELKPVDPDNPEARWVHPEKVCGYLTHKKDKQFFRNIFESGLLE